MSGGTHSDLHHDDGSRRGEHAGRSTRPLVKVRDLAWLELDKPDLAGAEAFAHAFGFATAHRGASELLLRGTDAGAPCLVVRRGDRSRLRAVAFHAAEASDLVRLADAHGVRTRRLPAHLGGLSVDLRDPAGLTVRVVADVDELPALPSQAPLTLNTRPTSSGDLPRVDVPRVNATQRPPREPARVMRLGHVVLQSTAFARCLDWYLDTLGMIVSDFLHFPGQRRRGPTMAFIRCDRGEVPTDHHTLALTLGPSDRYVHSAYEVRDLDALAAGGEHLADRGYRRSWGIGRHIQGSQVFDYWRDPDDVLVEHYTDGDRFDCHLEPGWAPMTASGLAQWGPTATGDFLGTSPQRLLREAPLALAALRGDTELDLHRLLGLMKVARS